MARGSFFSPDFGIFGRMSRLRTALKVVLAGALLASAGYSLSQLRALADLKRELAAPGAAPAEVLARLAGEDKTGVVRELVAAQLEQVRRLGADPGEAPGGAPTAGPDAPAPSEPPRAVRREARVGPGSGVFIDHRTGERTVVRSAAPRVPTAGLPAVPGALSDFLSDDLRSRRNRAVALLLGTVAVAVLLVLRARRALRT